MAAGFRRATVSRMAAIISSAEGGAPAEGGSSADEDGAVWPGSGRVGPCTIALTSIGATGFSTTCANTLTGSGSGSGRGGPDANTLTGVGSGRVGLVGVSAASSSRRTASGRVGRSGCARRQSSSATSSGRGRRQLIGSASTEGRPSGFLPSWFSSIFVLWRRETAHASPASAASWRHAGECWRGARQSGGLPGGRPPAPGRSASSRRRTSAWPGRTAR